MQRSLLILSLSLLLTACAGFKKSRASSGSNGPVFSWEKKEVAADAPKDAAPTGPQAPADVNKARIVSFNEKLGLISLMRADKAEAGAKLQLTKGEKALTVEVLKSDEKITVVGIIAGQQTVINFLPDEEVGCGLMVANK